MLKVGNIVTPDGNSRNKWLVIGCLGEGTCCEVYKVQNVQHPCTKAALKISRKGIHYERALDAEAMLLQLVIRANGSCENLVTTLDNFDYEGQPCLIQELLDLDLRQILTLNQGQGLSLYLVKKLAADMLRGLCHLHKSGFVHADLKPRNVMWSPGDGCVKIIDYSLSYHVQDKEIGKIQSNGYRSPEAEKWNIGLMHHADHSVTASEGIAPSPTFQNGSTEAFFPKSSGATSKDIPPKPSWPADLWSAGCLIFELATGEKLFTKDRSEEIKCDQKPFQSVIYEIVFCEVRKNDCSDTDSIIGSQGQLCSLISGLLHMDPLQRLTAQQALNHDFFKCEILPQFIDFCLLMSPVLRLMNVVEDEDLVTEESFYDLKQDLTDECAKYGSVLGCVIPREGPGKGRAYVEFADWEDARTAYSRLCTRLFNNHTVVVSYYPPVDYRQGDYH